MGWASLTPTRTVLLNHPCPVSVAVLNDVPDRWCLIPLLSSKEWTLGWIPTQKRRQKGWCVISMARSCRTPLLPALALGEPAATCEDAQTA